MSIPPITRGGPSFPARDARAGPAPGRWRENRLTAGPGSPHTSLGPPGEARPPPPQEDMMAWTTPTIEELACGMEINMYFPAEDDERTLF